MSFPAFWRVLDSCKMIGLYGWPKARLINAFLLSSLLAIFLATIGTYRVLGSVATSVFHEQSTGMPILVIALIGLLLLSRVSTTLVDYLTRAQMLAFNRSMNVDMAQAFLHLDNEYYEDPQNSDLLQNVKEKYTWLPAEYFNQVFLVVRDVLAVLIMASLFAINSPLLALVILLALVPDFVGAFVFGKRPHVLWDRDPAQREHFWLSTEYVQSQSYANELKLLGAGKYFLRVIEDFFDKFKKGESKIEARRTVSLLILNAVQILLLGIVVWSIATGSEALGISGTIFYLLLVLKVTAFSGSFAANAYALNENADNVQQVFNVLDRSREQAHSTGEGQLLDLRKPPRIEFNHVSFKYPNSDTWVFSDFSLSINSGEHVALVGPNGAGKTTLLKLLYRFYDPSHGHISVNGIDLKDLDLMSWRSSLSVLTQEFGKYHISAKENIGLGRLDNMENTEAIQEAAMHADAAHFIEQDFPLGYEQPLSTRVPHGIDPSGGQWQKIGLSRAFFRQGSVMILDEPTSSVDIHSEARIFESIFQKGRQQTGIIVSHRLSTVRRADRIIVVVDGTVQEEGTHESLMAKKGHYYESFQLQRKGYE